jgi:hypothetical protein
MAGKANKGFTKNIQRKVVMKTVGFKSIENQFYYPSIPLNPFKSGFNLP